MSKPAGILAAKRGANKRIQGFFADQLEFAAGEAEINKAVEKSKAAFYEGETAGMLTKLEFLYKQAGYIHKRFWAAQGLLLIILWWIISSTGGSFNIKRSMGICAPLFVALVMPELWKNRNAGAMEVECAAYYHLRQVYAARMMLFALVDLFLLSVFCIAVSFTARMSIWEFVIQFFMPFNVTCCICFGTLYSRKISSEAFALLLCIVWAAIWIQVVLTDRVYNAISIPVWMLMFAVSAVYIGYCIVRGQRDINKVL